MLFLAQCPEEVHDMANKKIFIIFALNCLETRHWCGEDYSIVLYRTQDPIKVQCQGDGCSISGKDGAIIRDSSRQTAVSLLTILEMAFNDRCWSHSLVNLRSFSVDAIMGTLSITILTETSWALSYIYTIPQWGRVSSNRILVFQAESLVSSRGRPIPHRSLQMSRLRLAWHQRVGSKVGSYPLFNLA